MYVFPHKQHLPTMGPTKTSCQSVLLSKLVNEHSRLGLIAGTNVQRLKLQRLLSQMHDMRLRPSENCEIQRTRDRDRERTDTVGDKRVNARVCRQRPLQRFTLSKRKRRATARRTRPFPASARAHASARAIVRKTTRQRS